MCRPAAAPAGFTARPPALAPLLIRGASAPAAMTLFYLIRHGRTIWNDEGRMQGWADPPLDDLGRQQARALARRLASERFAALYSSPLLRSRETAETVAGALGLPVIFDDRLRERNLGEWTGLTLAEAEALDPVRWAHGWRAAGPPGGENQAALMARVAAALDAIAAEHPEATVAVFSHGGTLSAYLTHALGIAPTRPVSFSFPNTAIARVSVRFAGGPEPDVRVITVGDDWHTQSL